MLKTEFVVSPADCAECDDPRDIVLCWRLAGAGPISEELAAALGRAAANTLGFRRVRFVGVRCWRAGARIDVMTAAGPAAVWVNDETTLTSRGWGHAE